ncbi:hypothetical protein K488DRAFT_86728 [Vararia minispora EC-137]|uniref:Uncharacterized protein n=1 Tax=Vararia minispora EC-137 TaxID=1314806 RepID=A0ACB8QIB9_9AGAM|nr:hypothetical protein K488DRAFT_86728 [Vararia minispora EC-137]
MGPVQGGGDSAESAARAFAAASWLARGAVLAVEAMARLTTAIRLKEIHLDPTDQILNMIPFGIGIAASTRVSSLIGARSANGACFVGHMSTLMSVLVGTVIMLALLATKDVFGYMFSDNEDVAWPVARAMPLLASFQITDGLTARELACGIVRCCGADEA